MLGVVSEQVDVQALAGYSSEVQVRQLQYVWSLMLCDFSDSYQAGPCQRCMQRFKQVVLTSWGMRPPCNLMLIEYVPLHFVDCSMCDYSCELTVCALCLLNHLDCIGSCYRQRWQQHVCFR
jgi:hypothetical protein